MCSPGKRMVKPFQNQDSCAFAHDESIAFFVERPGSMSWIIVSRRKCAHVGKSSDTGHCHRSIGRPCHDDICVASPNSLKSIPQHLGTTRAGTDDRTSPSIELEPLSYGSRDGVHKHFWNEKRGEARRPLDGDLQCFTFKGCETTYTARDVDGNSFPVLSLQIQP